MNTRKEQVSVFQNQLYVLDRQIGNHVGDFVRLGITDQTENELVKYFKDFDPEVIVVRDHSWEDLRALE